MRLRMLWYQFRMLTIRDGVKRTASDADHTGWSETYRIFKKTECICRYWRECDDSVS